MIPQTFNQSINLACCSCFGCSNALRSFRETYNYSGKEMKSFLFTPNLEKEKLNIGFQFNLTNPQISYIANFDIWIVVVDLKTN